MDSHGSADEIWFKLCIFVYTVLIVLNSLDGQFVAFGVCKLARCSWSMEYLFCSPNLVWGKSYRGYIILRLKNGMQIVVSSSSCLGKPNSIRDIPWKRYHPSDLRVNIALLQLYNFAWNTLANFGKPQTKTTSKWPRYGSTRLGQPPAPSAICEGRLLRVAEGAVEDHHWSLSPRSGVPWFSVDRWNGSQKWGIPQRS